MADRLSQSSEETLRMESKQPSRASIIRRESENRLATSRRRAKRKYDDISEVISTLSDNTLLILDVSSSMADRAGSQRKVDILRKAVQQYEDTNTKIIVFHSIPMLISSINDIPEPSGSTALHLALELAVKQNPRKTLIISDGYPDNSVAALNEVINLSGQINCLYIGSDGDRAAIEFMQQLSKPSNGRIVINDITQISYQETLSATIANLLPPSP